MNRNKTILSIIIVILIVIHGSLFAEQINFDTMKLSLEECIELARQNSYKTLESQLELDNLNLDLIDDWFVYLPSISYEADFGTLSYDSGENNPDSSFSSFNKDKYYKDSTFRIRDPGVAEESKFSREHTKHLLKFKQRLFDSSLLNIIKNTNDITIRREIIKTNLLSVINEMTRQLYYETLILEEKKAYIEKFTTDFKEENGDPVYILLVERIINEMEFTKLATERAIKNNKYTLLNLIRKPLDRELILTSKLTDVKIDIEKDTQLALQNSISMKQRYLTLNSKNKKYVDTILDFIPELDLELNHQISNNFNIGLDVNIDGNDIVADLVGEYLIYDNRDDLLVSKIDESVYKNNINNDLDFYDLTKTSLKVVGKIDIDALARNGVNLKQQQNNLKQERINIDKEEDAILLALKKQRDLINENKDELVLLEKRRRIYDDIKKQFVQNVTLDDIDTLKYFEEVLSSIESLINSYYNTKTDLYESVAIYYRIIDGKK